MMTTATDGFIEAMLSTNATRIIPGDMDPVSDLLNARFRNLGPDTGGFSLLRKATSDDDLYGHEDLGSLVPGAIAVALCSTNEVYLMPINNKFSRPQQRRQQKLRAK